MTIKLSSMIKFVISLSLLALLLWLMRGQYNTVIGELKRTNLCWFVSAIFIFVFSNIFCTIRLNLILAGEGIRIHFYRLLELTYIGFFFNNITPSSVGGDIVKAYYVGHSTGKKAKSYVSVFMDRFIGVFSLAFLGLMALALGWSAVENSAIKKSVLIFVILCFITGIVALNTKIAKLLSVVLPKITLMNLGEKLIKIYGIMHNYRNKKTVIVNTFIISVIAQAVYFMVIYLLFKAANLSVTVKMIFLIMPIVSMISMLPSIGGLGLREGAMVGLFGPIVGPEKAFGVSVLLLGALFLLSLIGGIIYLSSPQFRNVKIDEKGEVIS